MIKFIHCVKTKKVKMNNFYWHSFIFILLDYEENASEERKHQTEVNKDYFDWLIDCVFSFLFQHEEEPEKHDYSEETSTTI